jgi:hypothetical protein
MSMCFPRSNTCTAFACEGMLQSGIRAKVSTLSLDGPVERSLDQECEGKLSREDQFRTLVAPKRQGDTRRVLIKNSGSLAVQ